MLKPPLSPNAVVPGYTLGFRDGWDAARLGLRQQIVEARQAWLGEFDPCDGTDCVTPFDYLLYPGVGNGE